MYCTHYKTLEEFKAGVLSDLLENELEHCFLIGAIHKLPKETEEYIMLAVHDPDIINKEGKPTATFVAFRGVKPYPLIIASTVEKYLSSMKIVFDLMLNEKFLEDTTDWMGPRAVIRDLTNLINSHGKPVYLFRAMTHYSLTNVEKDIMLMVDKELSDGSSSFGRITLDDDWALDWGVGFYKDIQEPYVPIDHIKSNQIKMIQSDDIWKWQTKVDGSLIPVAMTAKHRETPQTASIASVYTPPELRGKGYATRCVASVCQHLLMTKGKKWITLLADQKNPVSNRVYIKLGFKCFQEVEHYKLKTE